MLASQCHPDVFEALKDREVVIWHNGADSTRIEEIVEPVAKGRTALYVPGGCTVFTVTSTGVRLS